MTEDAVRGFLTGAGGGDGMRAGGMTSGKAFSELVAAPQLMSRRERPDRRERAQGHHGQCARPPTEPHQHLYQGYAYDASHATPSAVDGKGIEAFGCPRLHKGNHLDVDEADDELVLSTAPRAVLDATKRPV